MPLTTYEMYNY